MARGMGGHSPSNVTHHLKGIHFPADKKALLQQARKNHAPREVMQELEAMPEQEYVSVAEIMKAFSQSHEGGGPERG